MNNSPDSVSVSVSVMAHVCSFGQEKCPRLLSESYAALYNGWKNGLKIVFPAYGDVGLEDSLSWFSDVEECLPPAQEWALDLFPVPRDSVRNVGKYRWNVECNFSRRYDTARFTERCAEITQKNPKRPCAIKSVHPAEILAAKLHNMVAAKVNGEMIYVVFEDGEVCITKCGDLLWQRSLHVNAPALKNFHKGCELPYPYHNGHSCALVETQEEAYQIRAALRIEDGKSDYHARLALAGL